MTRSASSLRWIIVLFGCRKKHNKGEVVLAASAFWQFIPSVSADFLHSPALCQECRENDSSSNTPKIRMLQKMLPTGPSARKPGVNAWINKS